MTDRPEFVALVLAAGRGTRMKSERPKVLHELAGRPMLTYPVQAALDAGASHVVVVVGPERQDVEAAVRARFGDMVTIAVQPEPRGTGDAARAGFDALAAPEGPALILYGDVTLIPPEAIGTLLEASAGQRAALSLLTCQVEDPHRYGRIIRDDEGRVLAIREYTDCSEQERAVTEVNPGIYAIDCEFFAGEITKLPDDNAQGELYLTDLVAAAARRQGVVAVDWDMDDLHGINDRFELAERERALRRRIARRHALAGVTIRDPDSAFIDADVHIEPETHIAPQVHLRGRCRIEHDVHIDVGCVLTDVRVAAGARLLPYTVADDSQIERDAQVGPFARLRPASRVGPQARVGNFVETKNTQLGKGSKANHLAYLGDGVIGDEVNIGCGTIFCNYDGVAKHVTTLEDGVFVGSDTQLVAPVKVGEHAYIATGTTVTEDVPPGAFAIGRARQVNKAHYAGKLKQRLGRRPKKDE